MPLGWVALAFCCVVGVLQVARSSREHLRQWGTRVVQGRARMLGEPRQIEKRDSALLEVSPSVHERLRDSSGVLVHTAQNAGTARYRTGASQQSVGPWVNDLVQPVWIGEGRVRQAPN